MADVEHRGQHAEALAILFDNCVSKHSFGLLAHVIAYFRMGMVGPAYGLRYFCTQWPNGRPGIPALHLSKRSRQGSILEVWAGAQ